MQPVCSKNTPSKSQHCSPLLSTINYEANMQQRGLCGSLCTIEISAESRWRKLEKRLKIKQIHVLELLGSQCIYDYRWAIRVLWMLVSCELWTALKNMVFTNKKTSILVRLYSAIKKQILPLRLLHYCCKRTVKRVRIPAHSDVLHRPGMQWVSSSCAANPHSVKGFVW